ncbi:hypothetical protein ACIO3O_12310 [Streptomyces sp. NPDC087440]|uniref:hypothetical protein n=1 Tax=Streptomyces sp. NPDC087440 TaxID=3365790 RepID=UPI0037F5465B
MTTQTADATGMAETPAQGTDVSAMRSTTASVPVQPVPLDAGAGARSGTGTDARAGTGAGARKDAGTGVRVSASRSGPADPVKVLMHRHRELCERAVDPLEIAAGLEAHGVTDRTAARFRHRDVFSLAEELYARVPRADEEDTSARHAPQPPAPGDALPAAWAASALLPGVLCALTLLGADRLTGGARIAVAAAGAPATLAAVALCLRRGPLRADGYAPWTRSCWLLLYAVLGDGVLNRLLGDGPLWAPEPATLLGLTAALAPAAWCARLLSVQARRRLSVSRGTEDFGAAVRPLLFGVFGLYAVTLTMLLYAAAGLGFGGAFAVSSLAVGSLLFLARLLAVHGMPGAGAAGLTAACTVEVLALAALSASRLPGCAALAEPVRAVVREWGTGAVPAAACGAAALGLLAHAAVALSRASAHAGRRD